MTKSEKLSNYANELNAAWEAARASRSDEELEGALAMGRTGLEAYRAARTKGQRLYAAGLIGQATGSLRELAR